MSSIAVDTIILLMISQITDAGKLIHLYKEELHTARVSLFIVVFVFFCWLPYFLATLLTKFNYQPGEC